jgi:hypothetical protein
MSDNPLITHARWLRAFLSARTPVERGALCREHLVHLLPTDPTLRAKTDWQAINLGNGSAARIGIVETVAGRPGARLLLVRGKKVIRTERFEHEALARHAAYLYDWTGAPE